MISSMFTLKAFIKYLLNNKINQYHLVLKPAPQHKIIDILHMFIVIIFVGVVVMNYE